MRWIFAAVAVLMLTGCGNFEWFPDTETTPSTSAPVITSFSPTSGPAGTVVTIVGANFSTTSPNIVTFNGKTAITTAATSTQLTAIVPTGATTGKISVAAGSISNTVTSATSFTVLTLMGGAVQGRPLTLSNIVSTIAGTAGNAGSSDGNGISASFYFHKGITTDGTNLYVADTGNNTIRKIVIATGEVSTLAGTVGIPGALDDVGTAASFNLPFDVTTDGTNLYVADSGNNTIRKIVIATGEVSTLAGEAEIPGFDDGVGAEARFDFPIGITTDGLNLYVSDQTNYLIRKIVIATGEVTTLAGTLDTTCDVNDYDGIGTAAQFCLPTGITTDGTNLYVADAGYNTIRQIVIASGLVSTLAGRVGVPGSSDGSGAAQFNSPTGITTDGTNLYLSDTANNTIRKIVIASVAVSTIAGTAGDSGSADGISATARFDNPNGITTDGTNLYVVDSNNSTIRKIQ